MINNKVEHEQSSYEIKKRNAVIDDQQLAPFRIALSVMVIFAILMVLFGYNIVLRKNEIRKAEYVANQMAKHVANDIAGKIDYAKSSIKLSAVTIAQTMTSETIENPTEIILPMVDNTPFGSIEYIRADGMNVMNIGEPFDASDRMYYIEGIKGNTGIWNNYHPKTSKETLMNFYTPLKYDNKIAGVITGYIEATTQIVPLFETNLYDEEIHGLLLDENNMVICSTVKGEFVKDLNLEMFMERFDVTEQQKQLVCQILSDMPEGAVKYSDSEGDGRVCVTKIPETDWKVAIFVPPSSFNGIINNNTRESVITIIIISVILMLYAAYVLISNVRRRKEIATENLQLEEENRRYDEENRRAFSEIAEIRDIIASANMGTWRIELVEGSEPRMFVDETMRSLLGIEGEKNTPEQVYNEWFGKVKPEAVESVLHSVERMKQGYFDENTYLWIHPKKGERYVRCGGTSQKIKGGFLLRGYHYDVDSVVREDQAKVVMLQNLLNEKNEYHLTLETLGGIFYSMHVIDLVDDSAVEFNAKNEVKEIVNHKNGASEMMCQVMTAVILDEYKNEALEFTDLSTVAERMKSKKIISKEFVGKHIGWFLASFITMDSDEKGYPTKIIFATRVIDDEKKQEKKLIKKTQTDELTGLLNRRAYEEDIYEYNDVPNKEFFNYISLDVNGLKVVNDSLGHTAGDELIIGACQCMKKSLGSYGKLYRIGGDEFVAILFCDTKEVDSILKDFDETIANWSGKLIDNLSISYGWTSKQENNELSVRQLGAIAEQRMYESKSAHYSKMGVDRRGQQDAHKALCSLYTKILKINITEDSYKIVSMDVNEQTAENGFSNKISEWLTLFGTTGHVHPDDLEEYLKATNIQYMREYFQGNKTSLHIFYRRRYGDDFKRVMMEIIPANDYSEDNESLFLYVKDIDK